MVPLAALESNFLVPNGTFVVVALVVLGLVALLVVVGVLVIVRSNARARRTDLQHRN
ncbi:hypothetical protein [Nocardioides sp. URHA0032]|uniref:hypothetical protein n=1 Tax=Nocardioides sp. URHA0032 TaxID=1380388 RepID=UPI000AEFFD33|nr:hypothetical protein [Nocardioides sp. URHA0032]